MVKTIESGDITLNRVTGFTQNVAGAVTRRVEDEETLKRRIKQLKEKERKIREERHRLEAELRERIFEKFKEIA